MADKRKTSRKTSSVVFFEDQNPDPEDESMPEVEGGNKMDDKRKATIEQTSMKDLAEHSDYLAKVPTPVIAIDREFNVLYLNLAGADAVGKTPEACKGQKCFSLFNTLHCNTPDCQVAKAMQTGSVCTSDTVARLPGGDLPIRYTGVALKDAQGNIIGGLEYIADIADIVKIREEMEQTIQEKTFELAERIKELDCLYGISSIAEEEGVSVEELLRGTVELITPGWQYPEITCSRITFEGQVFKTANFAETIWKQTADIIVNNQRVGTLDVCYLEEKPASFEGPFLKEERNLISEVARLLGTTIERIRARQKIQETVHLLGERMKEQHCLYGISSLAEQEDLSLENLLGNAWKFTAKAPRPRVEFGVTQINGEGAFFVRDNGVQRHGGRIWAEGAVDEGATFYFTL